MIAVICPVCNGKGEVPIADYMPGLRQCHGCPDNGKGESKGQGWVEVHEEPQHSYPMTLPELYPGLQSPEAWPEPTLYPGSITYVP